jgi:hypothetical protein
MNVSVSDILAALLLARADTFYAAYYLAELVAPLATSEISRLKHFDVTGRRKITESDIEMFHEVVVPGIPTLRDVLNSGQRSMDEFLKFLIRHQGSKPCY